MNALSKHALSKEETKVAIANGHLHDPEEELEEREARKAARWAAQDAEEAAYNEYDMYRSQGF